MTYAQRWLAVTLRSLRACSLGMLTAASAAPVLAAGPMDFLFTTGAPPASDNAGPSPRVWKLSEFSALRLTPHEAGAPANQHPVQVNPERLRVELAGIESTPRSGKTVALFSADELGELVPALVRALAAAGSGDDVLLFSTARRESGFLSIPLSVSARLFMQDGALQFIVNDVRSDVYGTYRVSRVVPVIGFGSRSRDSGAPIRSASAMSRRGDWLALPVLTASAALPPSASAAPTAPVAAPAAVIGPGAVPRPAEPSVPPRTRDAAFFAEQEQRLRSLKALREKDLITEEEYQQKRREILLSL